MEAADFESWWPHYAISKFIEFTPERDTRVLKSDLVSFLESRNFFVISSNPLDIAFAARQQVSSRARRPGDLFMGRLQWTKKLVQCTVKAECSDELLLAQFLEKLSLPEAFKNIS